MVVDLQGTFNEKRREFVLYDPALHCSVDPLRFGDTNLAERGMQMFFMTHVCNVHCKALGLEAHRMQSGATTAHLHVHDSKRPPRGSPLSVVAEEESARTTA